MPRLTLTLSGAPEGDGLPKLVFELLGALAWPAVVLILVWWFRHPLFRIVAAIEDRLRDRDTDWSLGKEGLSAKRHDEVVAGREEALEVAKEQVKLLERSAGNLRRIVVGDPAAQPEPAAGAAAPIGRIEELIARYESPALPDDKGERVSVRNEVANEMGAIVRSAGLRERVLALRHVGDGAVAAVASAIVLGRAPGDAEALLRVAGKATFKHARYRVALAVIQLASERGTIAGTQRERFQSLLAGYELDELGEETPDKSLLKVIARARDALRVPPPAPPG